jgi:alkylhydroperoxidase family enzyme
MARITGISADGLDGSEAGEYRRILAHRKPLADALHELKRVLRTERLLSDRLLELVRLRCAYWNQCRACMATRFPEAYEDGLTENVVCSLERPQDAENLTPAERAAIVFADLMATDHLAITDDTFSELRRHFSEPEIVELGINIAYNVGVGRFSAVLDVTEDLPERFLQEGVRITPWGGGEVMLAHPRS